MPIIYNPPRLLVPSRRFAPDFLWAIGAQGPQAWTAQSSTKRASSYVADHTSAGLAVGISTTTDHVETWSGLTTSDGAGTGDITLLVVANPSAASSRNALFGQGANDCHIAIYANTSSAWGAESGTLTLAGWNGSAFREAISTNKIDGAWHCFAGRRAGTALTVWRDGVSVGSGSGTVGDYHTTTTRLGVGLLWVGGTDFIFGSTATRYQIAAGWNRALSDLEMALLGANPWLLFEPQKRRVWVPVAGGIVTLTVQDAAHSHSADSLGLTQQNVLEIADCLHSHLADGVVLSQAATLAVAECLHGHSSDNVALVQQHLLAVASALHSHLSDSPALVQASVLSVAGAEHSHTSDNAVLTTAVTLAVLDCLHSHLADGLDLSQAATLAVAECLHQHVVDNLDLSGAAVLDISSALHGHDADNIALSQAHVLAVADCLHQHGVDAFALTQQNLLAVQGAIHAHAAESPAVTEQTVLEVQECIHQHLADSFGLTQAHLLVVNDTRHEHLADGALNIVQAGTLIVSDALHAHIADLVNLRLPGLGTATVFVVPAERSVFLIARETRIFPVRN